MSAIDAQKFAPIGALIMANLESHAQVEAISAKEVKELSDIAVASMINGGAIRGEGFFMIEGTLSTAQRPMVKAVQKEEKIVLESRDLAKEIEALEKQIKELESIEGAFHKADEIATIIESRFNDGKVIGAHLEFLANLLIEKTKGYDLESLVIQIKELRSQRMALKKELKTEAEAETKAKVESEKDEAVAKATIKEIIVSDVAEASEVSEETISKILLRVARQRAVAHARQCKAAKKEAERIADAKIEAQKEARAARAARKAARKAARIQRNGCLLLEKTLKCLQSGASNYDQVASMLKQARQHHLKLDAYIELMSNISELSDKYDLTMRCIWRIFWSKKRELNFSIKKNLQDILDLVMHKIELHLNPSPIVTSIKKVAKKVTNVIIDVRNVIYQHKNGKYIRYTY